MRKLRLTLGLFYIIAISSCVEKETELSVYYVNTTDRNIQLFTFPGEPFSVSSDTSWFNISPFENHRVHTTSIRGESSSLPSNMFPFFTPTDSCVVVFSDTLRVPHFTIRYSRNQDTVREDVIAFDDSRNIFNQDYFDIEKIGDNQFKATYHFTEEDVDYAISINE